MKDYSYEERTKILNEYLSMYGDSYSERDIEILRNDFGKSTRDHISQIYYAMNMLNDEENPYLKLTNLIEKIYGLDLNVLEVGGGIYPALSKSISRRQEQIGKGHITVYDPMLSRKLDFKNITLQKQNFYSYIDTSKYDIIIGKEPCAATFDVIDSANKYKKELLLSPCKCYSLLPEYMEFDNNPLEQWYDFVKMLITNYNEHKVDTYHLNKETNYDNPIYVKRLTH